MIDTSISSCTNSNASLGIDQACFSILNLYINPVIFYAIAWGAYTVCIHIYTILKLIYIYQTQLVISKLYMNY